MVDVSITAIALGADAQIKKVKFGEAAAVGAAVYFDSAAGTWKNADADAGAAQAGADGIGIVINEIESANEYGVVVTSGTIFIDTGLTKGVTYVVSNTAGRIAPNADAASGWFKTVLGVAGDAGGGTNSHDEFIMQPLVSGQDIA